MVKYPYSCRKESRHGKAEDILAIKVQQYSLDELFEKKLLFFLPFFIFNHEKELAHGLGML